MIIDNDNKVRFLPFKCPNCNGYGEVGKIDRHICPVCIGTGIVVIDQETGKFVKNDDNKNYELIHQNTQ
jgi:RecJ-like exonuclease